jgi:hypothetical protein
MRSARALAVSLRGHTISGYSAVVNEAHKLGIPFDPSKGMNLQQAQELLNGFGVQSHIEQPASTQQAVDELAQYLEQGKSVILSVNVDPIWYGTQTSSDNPDGGPDHGNEEQVPYSTFMAAWEASGCEMLVSDHSAGTEDSQVWSDTERIEGIATTTVHHGETEAGFVILSIGLGMGVRRVAQAARARLSEDQQGKRHRWRDRGAGPGSGARLVCAGRAPLGSGRSSWLPACVRNRGRRLRGDCRLRAALPRRVHPLGRWHSRPVARRS